MQFCGSGVCIEREKERERARIYDACSRLCAEEWEMNGLAIIKDQGQNSVSSAPSLDPGESFFFSINCILF
jgi:hypothetical protein